MSGGRRLALAIPPTSPDPAPASLALMSALARRRVRVQHYRCRADFVGTGCITQITGQPGRHLDAWLMSPPTYREILNRGAQGADWVLVEGTLAWDPVSIDDEANLAVGDGPGPLRVIAESLDLPVLGVVPAEEIRLGVAQISSEVDAVLIDGVRSPQEFETLSQRVLDDHARRVVGAIEPLEMVREEIRRLDRDDFLGETHIDALTRSFLKYADWDGLERLANCSRLWHLNRFDEHGRSEHRPAPEIGLVDRPSKFRVAYAQDEAFGRYFPDTLEMLESWGAELVEFSPLRDAFLPSEVDLVMIGCGPIHDHLDRLTSNHSLIASLCNYVCMGHALYSEGGGTAYLGRSIQVDSEIRPGANILPIEARFRPQRPIRRPVTRSLLRTSWLGGLGTEVRGYASGLWETGPVSGVALAHCPHKSGVLTEAGDLIYHQNAVGSLIHLYLPALPQLARGFLGQARKTSCPNPSVGRDFAPTGWIFDPLKLNAVDFRRR